MSEMRGTIDLGGFNRIRITRDGPILYNVNDAYVGRSIELYGEYNRAEQDLLLALIDEHSVVIEAGANIGSHTIPMAKKAARVYAFEPQRIVYQALCANIALNCLANVIAYHMGVGAHSAFSMLCPDYDPRRPCNFGGLMLRENSVTTERCDEVEVPVTSLDQQPIIGCHLLKIDVEGMESEVIRGAESLIGHHRPLIYVENDRTEKSEALIALLRSADYRLYWHLPRLYNPRNWAANPENVFGAIASVNMLCLPAERTTPVVSWMHELKEVTGPRPGE